MTCTHEPRTILLDAGCACCFACAALAAAAVQSVRGVILPAVGPAQLPRLPGNLTLTDAGRAALRQ